MRLAWKTQAGHSPPHRNHAIKTERQTISSLHVRLKSLVSECPPADPRYFFFAAAFRTVALPDAIGVQISILAGTRSLPAAKSASSVDD